LSTRPDFSGACWFHNRGIKGATAAIYRKPLITKSMGSTGTLEEWKTIVVLKGAKCYQNSLAQVAIIYLNENNHASWLIIMKYSG
jgi:hypothetical protein